MSSQIDNWRNQPLSRVKLTIEFDGAPFSGWQWQANGLAVQQVIEEALEGLLLARVRVQGAGRTDAGVHALGMTAHCDLPRPFPAERLPIALTRFLPRGVCVTRAEAAADDFDARRDALLRWYRYQILPCRLHHPLAPRAMKTFLPLDFDLMQECVSGLVGEHEFAGFRAEGCTAERTILTMRQATLARHGPLLVLDFKCQSFLRRMVRLMTGGIVAAGEGRLTPREFLSVLEGAPRHHALRCAPPEGLCLMRVAYTADEVGEVLACNPPAPSF